jgi:hypothetical protein
MLSEKDLAKGIGSFYKHDGRKWMSNYFQCLGAYRLVEALGIGVLERYLTVTDLAKVLKKRQKFIDLLKLEVE